MTKEPTKEELQNALQRTHQEAVDQDKPMPGWDPEAGTMDVFIEGKGWWRLEGVFLQDVKYEIPGSEKVQSVEPLQYKAVELDQSQLSPVDRERLEKWWREVYE